MKKYLATIVILGLCGCQNVITPHGYDRNMVSGAPRGTPAFRDGWKAGCESGFTVMPSGFMKTTHNFSFNPQMIQDAAYNEAWYMGFNHCRWYGTAWYRHM